jgi:hypothetical protein
MHLLQTTMHDMFKQQSMNHDFCQKKLRTYPGWVLKQENTIVWNGKQRIKLPHATGLCS